MTRSIRLFLLLLVSIAALGGCSSEQAGSSAPSSSSAAAAVPDPADSFRGVRLVSKQGEVIKEWASAAINLFQPVRTGLNEQQLLEAYIGADSL
ncbi:hypothetical protein MKZ24_22975 [Paenibacillus sp. FSL R7-0297]|uniref:hypothetical protein n=1 Tax=Paenibacillus sp. FSL R7-0297 TaxID=2921680 RepID=UPI0030F665A1